MRARPEAGAIDSRAFQTNILALNAAVEAAPASMVGALQWASEVHALAQLLAQSAREIKSLIHTSVERIADGSRLADESEAAMQDIAQRIGEVRQTLSGVVSTVRQ